MTYEKAIEQLVCDKFMILCASKHPDKVTLEEIDMARKAIEKQMPKKVVPYKTLDMQLLKRCPCCNCIVGSDDGSVAFGMESNFCWNCGQALDWGDEE